MAKRPKESNEWKSWALIIVLFLFGLWPIALVLMLYKIFGSGKKQGDGKAVKMDGGCTVNESGAAKAAYRGNQKFRIAGMKIFGSLLTLAGAIRLGETAEALFWSSDWVGLWLSDFLTALLVTAVGGFLIWRGVSRDKELKRYSRYLAVMGDREAVAVSELAQVLDYPGDQVERDLKNMIDRGYFGGRAYVDVGRGFLFRTSEAADRMAREQAETERRRQAEDARTAEGEYDRILRQIRQANDDIDDPALSKKIQRLEDITAQIFRLVEAEPRKRSRIDKLLDYYLPTTQKLLDSYARFESAGVEGENLRQAKLRIEKTMDSIVAGFEHQLDQLYKDEAMDVDSDIRVMETMLNRDTASVERDFGLKTSGYE